MADGTRPITRRCADRRRTDSSAVYYLLLFINNEQAIISNMARPGVPTDLRLYRPTLDEWIPRAAVRHADRTLARFDGLLTLRVDGKTVRYLIEEKRHFRHL